MTIYAGNDTLVWINGLENGVTGSAVTNATGTGYVKVLDGAKVPKSEFTMTHTSDGDYYGTISRQAELQVGMDYVVVVEMLDSSSNRAYFQIDAEVEARTE